MWQSVKRCLVMGDQCHWLPVREQEEKQTSRLKKIKMQVPGKAAQGCPDFREQILGETLKSIVRWKTTSLQVQGPSPLRKPLFPSLTHALPKGVGSQDSSWYRCAEFMDVAT